MERPGYIIFPLKKSFFVVDIECWSCYIWTTHTHRLIEAAKYCKSKKNVHTTKIKIGSCVSMRFFSLFVLFLFVLFFFFVQFRLLYFLWLTVIFLLFYFVFGCGFNWNAKKKINTLQLGTIEHVNPLYDDEATHILHTFFIRSFACMHIVHW